MWLIAWRRVAIPLCCSKKNDRYYLMFLNWIAEILILTICIAIKGNEFRWMFALAKILISLDRKWLVIIYKHKSTICARAHHMQSAHKCAHTHSHDMRRSGRADSVHRSATRVFGRVCARSATREETHIQSLLMCLSASHAPLAKSKSEITG